MEIKCDHWCGNHISFSQPRQAFRLNPFSLRRDNEKGKTRETGFGRGWSSATHVSIVDSCFEIEIMAPLPKLCLVQRLQGIAYRHTHTRTYEGYSS